MGANWLILLVTLTTGCGLDVAISTSSVEVSAKFLLRKLVFPLNLFLNGKGDGLSTSPSCSLSLPLLSTSSFCSGTTSFGLVILNLNLFLGLEKREFLGNSVGFSVVVEVVLSVVVVVFTG